MRKRFISLSVSLLLLTMLALPAQAASANLSDPEALLPVDIIIDQDSREIRKVYDLSPNTEAPPSLSRLPAAIPIWPAQIPTTCPRPSQRVARH